MTLDDPVDPTGSNYFYVANGGTTPFQVSGTTIAPGQAVLFLWDSAAAVWFPPPAPSVTIPGASGDMLFNSGGSLAAAAGITTDGTIMHVGEIDSLNNISNAGTFNGIVISDVNGQNLTFAFAGGAQFVIKNQAGAPSVVFDSPTGNLAVHETFNLVGNVPIGDLPGGGSIGTAASTVDIAASASITQTTVGQTVTVPNPTDATFGRQFT